MNTNKASNQNFGWNYKTHYLLTKNAVENIPSLKKYATPLAIASLSPDIKLSQTSIGYNMAHYFAGEDFNSYDLVPQNASDFYFDNLLKSLNYLKYGYNFIGMLKAGHALHFLQDMAVPLHTHPDCFSKLKILKHMAYESIPGKNPSLFDFALVNKLPEKIKDFHDCFLDTYKKSSLMDNPYKIPKEQWTASVKESIKNAYEHTYMFLKRLAWLKDIPNSKRQEIFSNETFSGWKTILQDKDFSIFRDLYKEQAVG